MGEMVEPPLLAVPLPRRVDEAQITRLTDAVGFAIRAVEETRLERDGNRLWKANADETAGRNRVSRTNEAGSLARRFDLPFLPGWRLHARNGVLPHRGLGKGE
jgi:hypothetical protein